MLMPKKKLAVAIAIGYKDEAPSLAVKEFETGSEAKLYLTLAPATLKEVKAAIRAYEQYAKENRIRKDLAFMEKFFGEKQRQQQLINEYAFLSALRNRAYPCCPEPSDSTSPFLH